MGPRFRIHEPRVPPRELDLQHQQREVIVYLKTLHRWRNHLDPTLKKKQWSEDEELQLLEAHRLIGNKWAEIAKVIPGRTDNQIKNFFYTNLRKNIARIEKGIITPE